MSDKGQVWGVSRLVVMWLVPPYAELASPSQTYATVPTYSAPTRWFQPAAGGVGLVRQLCAGEVGVRGGRRCASGRQAAAGGVGS
jgi:hypothetical protein